jgi:hypothetical protein
MKLKSFLVVLTAVVMLLPSCNDSFLKEDVEEPYICVDWGSIVLKIFVVDYNWRTNYVANNYNDIVHTITLTYNGKNYSVKDILNVDSTFSYDGFGVDSTATEQPFFYFGELDGYRDYDDDFVIHFADGTCDSIHFKRVHTSRLEVDDKWTLNGEEYGEPVFYLCRTCQNGELVR